MRTAALLLALALVGCAHAKSPEELLAEIDTSTYSLPTDLDATYSLASHRGHVIVMQFFSTWCVPCLAEINQLKVLGARHEGLEVIGVAFDLDAKLTLNTFRANTGIEYPLLLADETTRTGKSTFGLILELPTTVVIDREGAVRSAFTGLISDEDLDKLIKAAN